MADDDRADYFDDPAQAYTSDFDRDSADIPIWGWLSGAQARRDADRARAEQQTQQRAWMNLAGDAPTAEDLSVEYQGIGTEDEYGDLLGGPSELERFGPSHEQRYALDALRSLYEQGGYTDADRAFAAQQRAARAQQIGGMNRAAVAAQEARGTGGGGLGFAAQMGGGQALANANAMGDASVQQQAMQRALQALYGYQGQANAQQQMEMQRRQALDAFNQRGVDWRRQRAGYNTDTSNRQQDQNAGARQQAYGNQQDAVAGATGQYAAGAGERMFGQQRQDQANQAAASGIGSFIEAII